jgi:pimeloyl-ACP methyl ester carboxylesterase
MIYPDYPFESRHASVKGLKLHYLDEGPKTAAPVIMLHGNPSWSFYYRHLVCALQDKYRCIVPDHVGMGLSEKPNEGDYDFGLDSRVDDLETLLEQLDIKDNITLVVHDWGGMIGLSYATRHPQSIKRLVILNTAAFHLPKTKKMPWQLQLSRIPVLNALLNQGLNAFCRGAVRYCVTRRPMSNEIARAYLAPYNSWQNRLAIKKFVEAIPLKPGDNGYDTLDRVDRGLDQFSALPMFIGWGLRDFVFDKHFLKEWQTRFPDAELYRFEDAGHYVLEDAVEDIVPLIRKFIDAHPVMGNGVLRA